MKAIVLLFATLCLFAEARADEVRPGIAVDNAWARASATPTASVYLTLRNGGEADRLTGVTTDRAASAQLHRTVQDGQVMRMRPVAGIDLPAHGSVALRPGGLHIMLMGLKAPLKAGDTLPVTRHFQKAGDVAVSAAVLKAGATGAGADDKSGGAMMDHDHMMDHMMDHQHMMPAQ